LLQCARPVSLPTGSSTLERAWGVSCHSWSSRFLRPRPSSYSCNQRVPSSKSKNWNNCRRINPSDSNCLSRRCSSYRSVCILAISGSEFQSATEVIAALQQQAIGSQPLPTLLHYPTGRRQWPNSISKFRPLLPSIPGGLGCHSLSAEHPSPQTSNWLTRLLPVVYWQQQLRKTKSPAPKLAYQSGYTHAHRLYSQDSLTPTISPKELQQWWTWAVDGKKFQRTSLLSRVAMVIYLVCITVVGLSVRRLGLDGDP